MKRAPAKHLQVAYLEVGGDEWPCILTGVRKQVADSEYWVVDGWVMDPDGQHHVTDVLFVPDGMVAPSDVAICYWPF